MSETLVHIVHDTGTGIYIHTYRTEAEQKMKELVLEESVVLASNN